MNVSTRRGAEAAAPLLTAAAVELTRFDGRRFVRIGPTGAGTPCRGLTPLLAKAFRANGVHARARCKRCARVALACPRAACVSPRAHGLRVDRELASVLLTRSLRFADADACTQRLAQHIAYAERLRVVAAQVPLYMPALGAATAIDLVCTDAATRRQLVVVELKTASAADAECYERAGRASAYWRDQMQLWAMYHALTVDARVTVDRALVIRGNAQGVRTYALDMSNARARARLRAAAT